MSHSPDEPRSSPASRLLLVDVGNTRMKFGIFRLDDGAKSTLPACEAFAALPSAEPDPWDTLADQLATPGTVISSAITGSNPRHIDRLVASWPADWPSPNVWRDRTKLPIEIDLDQPERVGIDRLLDAVAANVLRSAGVPAIVIDVGTATTVNAVSKSGAFIGGAILPGPELCARALHDYTAVLPEVSLADLSREEPPVIGRDTEAAIASGLYWGHWQAVLGYCERMRSPLGCPPEPLVVLTGGAAHLYAGRIPTGARYEPHLTLQGLAISVMSALRGEEKS
ncbi:MAG: type III pantothenate kinase [Planctomycetaceae bacterium]|nr:type III pantothenate kinase [Planctomycetaceae bacterium]